jgi:hypothetical protein
MVMVMVMAEACGGTPSTVPPQLSLLNLGVDGQTHGGGYVRLTAVDTECSTDRTFLPAKMLITIHSQPH